MSFDIRKEIESANSKAMSALLDGQPVWIDVQLAGEVIPAVKENVLLHAGPPLRPEHVAPPLKTSLCGAAIHERLAKSLDEAWKMIEAGELLIDSAQDNACTCGAVMTVSASTPVIVVEDKVGGRKGYSSIHPGHATETLRWGCYNNNVERQLVWFRDVYGPALGEAVRSMGGLDVHSVMARTTGMGDEHHNRQYAASLQLICDMIPAMLDLKIPERDQVTKELAANERFFLHVLMAGAIGVIESAKDIPLSTVMTGFGGNGHSIGLQFSGTGRTWFTAAAPKVLGQMLNPSWTEKDIIPMLGDSCITEVYGFGGLAAVAGPSYVRLTGGDFAEAQRRTNDARQICLGERNWATIPWDNFRGLPVGVDMRKVVATGIVPTSHGGSVHLDGGQGGAGSVSIPLDCFKQGLKAFSEQIKGVS